jgi:anti-anti-sigma factor
MFQQALATVKQFPDCRDPLACRNFYRDFCREIRDMYQPEFVFDMSAVQHLNAAGIDLLLKCVVEIANRDGELKLAAASPQIALILELTQMNELLDVRESVEDALQSFGAFRIPDANRFHPAARAA